MSIVAALVLISLLVLVHELGHFLVAKRYGMDVRRFSVGFGPALVRWRRHETEYQIALFPLGGYVLFDDDLGQIGPHSFWTQPIGARMAVTVAGVIANAVFGFVLMAVLFAGYGIPSAETVVQQVLPGTPAAAHLRAGDILESLDGARIPASNIAYISNTLARHGLRPVTLSLLRGGRRLTVQMTPERLDGGVKMGVVLETVSVYRKTASLPVRIVSGFKGAAQMVSAELNGLVQIVRGRVSLHDLAGPIRIVSYTTRALAAGPSQVWLWLVALSLNLAIVNILPLPALDGGRLIFLLLEVVRGKRLDLQVEGAINMVGFVGLMLLVVLVSLNDISQIFH